MKLFLPSVILLIGFSIQSFAQEPSSEEKGKMLVKDVTVGGAVGISVKKDNTGVENKIANVNALAEFDVIKALATPGKKKLGSMLFDSKYIFSFGLDNITNPKLKVNSNGINAKISLKNNIGITAADEKHPFGPLVLGGGELAFNTIAEGNGSFSPSVKVALNAETGMAFVMPNKLAVMVTGTMSPEVQANELSNEQSHGIQMGGKLVLTIQDILRFKASVNKTVLGVVEGGKKTEVSVEALAKLPNMYKNDSENMLRIFLGLDGSYAAVSDVSVDTAKQLGSDKLLKRLDFGAIAGLSFF